MTRAKQGAASRSARYRDLVNVDGLAHLIEADDPIRGERWGRKIEQWLAVDHPRAPEPQTIRRVLTALGFDWVVGLGLSGYHQHAIAMLHVLYDQCAGNLPAIQARAIFQSSASASDPALWRSSPTRVTGRLHELSPEEKRLDKAAHRCWRDSDVDGLPTRASIPNGLSRSQKLFIAWCVLETALNGKNGTLEERMEESLEIASPYVLSWSNDIATL